MLVCKALNGTTTTALAAFPLASWPHTTSLSHNYHRNLSKSVTNPANRPSFPLLKSAFESQSKDEKLAADFNREKNLKLFSEVEAIRTAITSRDNEMMEKERASRKLTVQERIDLLRDEDSDVFDIGLLAGWNMPYGRVLNASNAVSIVTVAGETCVVSANVWTFKGGTLYPISVKKQLRAQEVAMENRLPCIYLVDSGGAFLPLQVSAVFRTDKSVLLKKMFLIQGCPYRGAITGIYNLSYTVCVNVS